MQRLLPVIILAVVLIGLPLLVLGDSHTSTAGADIPRNDITDNVNETDNASASATITITTHTGDGQ